MKYCSNCGRQIGEEVSFCPYCGTAIVSQNDGQTTLLQSQGEVGNNSMHSNSTELESLSVLKTLTIIMLVISIVMILFRSVLTIVIFPITLLASGYWGKAQNAKTKEEGAAAFRKGKICLAISCILFLIFLLSLILLPIMYS